MIDKLKTIIAEKSIIGFLNTILGVPMEEIGDEIGVTRSYISLMVSGQRQIGKKHLALLARMLEHRLDELANTPSIGEDGDKLIAAILRLGDTLLE